MFPVMSEDDALRAGLVGLRRHFRSMLRSSRPRYPHDELQSIGNNVNGACAELYVANATGRPWPGHVDVGDAPDLPPDWQVKAATKADGCLYIPAYMIDRPELYWLVTGVVPKYRIVGSISTRLAKRPEWFLTKEENNGLEAYRVPQSALVEVPL